MQWLTSYKLRLKRKSVLLRAFMKRNELHSVVDRTDDIAPDDIIAFVTIRNEKVRLPYFLQYYRNLGVNHFIVVDNDSDDGSVKYLAGQPDVSLWNTKASYKASRFGMDWINRLLARYGHNHWTLVVDVDEFLVYPFFETRPLRALTDYLEKSGVRSLSTMLLDMYPKGPLNAHKYKEGQDPLEIASWFDSGNYTYKLNPNFKNLWIQGGVRARVFFQNNPKSAPALNKVALVKWQRNYAYVSSTHMLLPRGLNKVYELGHGEKCCGLLLHTKFLNTIVEKSAEELDRRQHYNASIEYKAYQKYMTPASDLWCKHSKKYSNWRELEALGLMSSGNWI